jgi:hypothetical protein
MRFLLAAVLAAASLARSEPSLQLDDRLALRAVRFYRADHRTTRVTAFLEIPYAALVDPAGGGAGTGYQVTVRVADSTGAVLHTESWTGTVPPSAQAGAAAVETVEFLVASGRYRLDAVARNPLTGREARATLELEGFDRPPAVSDLLLSPGIRLVSAGDTVPQPGELRRGGALVTAAAVPRLGPAHTTAHYLLEMYATGNHEEVGNITVSVRDSTGTTTLRWRPVPVRVPSGGSTLHGHVSLAGLKPGRYTLVVSVAVAGQTNERGAELVVDGGSVAQVKSVNSER